MTLSTLARRSLLHHARAHLGAILGAAVAAAVLIGALVVGDSVRLSLRDMALARLGQIHSVLASNDRLFSQSLGPAFSRQTGASAATALMLPGSAVNSDASTRANSVQVVGVTNDFWKLAPKEQGFLIPPDGALINRALATQLRANVGDSVLLRIQKPSQLSQDAPLAKAEDHTVAMRVNVEKILSDDEFGRFGLQASQIPPFTAFVDRAILQQRAGATNKNNLLLMGGIHERAQLNETIQKVWSPADAELEFRTTPGSRQIELRSSRVFIDPAVAEAALKASPNAQPVLTYFVNQLKLGEKATPYSMVTAMGTNLGPDEIIVSQWVADDLGAKAGDAITLSYFVVGPMRRLTEGSATFKIKEIVPIQGIYADRSLMPDFPGLTDAANCRDWDTGFPIKTDAIRDKDEKYWDDHRGTPKAFINLARGQQLWGNRFGSLTSIRWDGTNQAEIAKSVMDTLKPASVGLRFEPIREQALAASSQGQDFGQLFLSFSFFLIVAALMLMTLLFGFSVEQRSTEIGTLLAIGLRPKQVRRMLFLEGIGLAIAGTLLGLCGGIIYAKGLLAALSTIWKNAVGTTALAAHIQPITIINGVGGAIGVAVITLYFALRKQARRPARELLAPTGGSEIEIDQTRGAWLPISSAAAALGLTAAGLMSQQSNPGLFFGGGALVLIAAISAGASWMRWKNSVSSQTLPNLHELALRNIARRRKRSRAVLILLGCGAFIVSAVGAFRLDSGKDANARDSGTGGFMFAGEATLPIVHDLNTAGGRDFYGLNARMTNLHFVPLRVRTGDEASCLNLNKAQKPRLLGVDPEALKGRFKFSGGKDLWPLLSNSAEPGVVPAIGDAASIQWALKAKIGDTIDYEDERGRQFKIKLVGGVANSLLQGNLLISEGNFIERFPTEAGYRMLLIDAPSNMAEDASRDLTRAFQDYGLELTRASDRLNAFNAVQNTYISTFQALGGLGLVLGSFGLGVVVLRNVFERRNELALLQAVGFTRQRVRKLILREHAMLMAAGLAIGAGAAFIAVLPQLIQTRGALPLMSLAVTLASVVVFGLAATWFATSLALRDNLLESLRSE